MNTRKPHQKSEQIEEVRKGRTFHPGLEITYDPFGPLTDWELTRVLAPHKSFGHWLKNLTNSRYILLLHGPTGVGKSAHLRALSHMLPGASYYLATGPEAIIPFEEGAPILIDNFHVLGRKAQKFILELETPLAIASAKSHKWTLRKSTKLLDRVALHTLSGEELAEVLGQRIVMALDNPSTDRLFPDPEKCDALLRAHKGDVGKVLAHLSASLSGAQKWSDLPIL